MKRALGVPVLAALLVAATVLAPTAALAERTTGWASWAPLSGGANDYRTTMQLPGLGFPAATMTSDSRAPAQLPSGASTFLGGAGDTVPTAVGTKYGSSHGQAYLNLRPRADTPTTPSTTTYTFAAPTPATGWTFVLGDIDADQVTIAATGADGRPVGNPTIDGWFKGSFNYAGDADQPTWNGGSATLTGNPGAVDTNGASAWFEPDVALTSLTFVFTRRAGFPVYQTWFASVARTLSGTVTDASTGGAACAVTDVLVRLQGPDGEDLGTRHPAGDGSFSFGQVATQPGYTVGIEAPDGCAVVGAQQRTVSTAASDATADFSVRRIVPQLISGTVVDTAGNPVGGVTVTRTQPGGGGARSTTTDADGHYLFDDNLPGTGYTVSVTAPDGYTVSGADTRTVDVANSPVTVPVFTLAPRPSVSGVVTGGGAGLGGVTVTLTPDGGGPALTTATRGDGSYDFVHVPTGGGYTISVTPPDGYDTASSRHVTIGSDDLTGQDFDLTRPGALGGTVADVDGTPLPDVPVTVDGPGGSRQLTTDAQGDFFLDELPAGNYTVTVTVPDGYQASSPTSRTETITTAGEIRGGLDFVLEATAATTTPPTSTPPTSTPPAAGSTGPAASAPAGSTTTSGAGTLADTGVPVSGLLAGALALLLVGAGCTLAGRRRAALAPGGARTH